jgi:hypothetical protein
MVALFDRGWRPLLQDTRDNLVEEAAGHKYVFRGGLEEANDALMVGDDQEWKVCRVEASKDIVGDN